MVGALGAALAVIQVRQIERDKQRLVSKKLTTRSKDRILPAEQVTALSAV